MKNEGFLLPFTVQKTGDAVMVGATEVPFVEGIIRNGALRVNRNPLPGGNGDNQNPAARHHAYLGGVPIPGLNEKGD